MSVVLLYWLTGLSASRKSGEQKQIVSLLGGNNQWHVPTNNTTFSGLWTFKKKIRLN